jgi:hypothetical protein
MDAERRARETESAAIERSHHSIDHGFRREWRAAPLAGLQLDRSDHALPWNAQRTMGSAGEATKPATQIEPDPVHHDDFQKTYATGRADKHWSNVSSILQVESIASACEVMT